MVGNGFCNDDTNIAECDYDGGDCCGYCVVTDHCENCACLGNITSGEITNPLVEMAYVMMKQIISIAIMMVETVVDTTSPQSIALNAHASTKRLA